MTLAQKRCEPCHGGTPPLAPERVAELAREVPDWRVVDGERLERRFEFPDFARALAFVDALGAEAEEQGHHPDVRLGWGYAEVTFLTHAIGGLSEADFIMAARCDALAP